jgi:hypothetical protein
MYCEHTRLAAAQITCTLSCFPYRSIQAGGTFVVVASTDTLDGLKLRYH